MRRTSGWREAAKLALLVWLIQSSISALAVPTKTPDVDDTRVKLSLQDMSTFSIMCRQIAAQVPVTFVAEGVSLKPALTSEDSAALQRGLPIDVAVSMVASACDYTVQRRNKVFLLKKSYDNPQDLPPVTEAECEETFRAIQRLAEPFNPHVPPINVVPRFDPKLPLSQYRLVSPLTEDLAASLTPEQLNMMHDGRLRVSSLTVTQRNLVRRVALYLYVQTPFSLVDQAATLLPQFSQAAVFHWGTLGVDQHLFGFDRVAPPQNHVYFVPLSGPFSRATTLGPLFFHISGPPAPPAQDPTTPDQNATQTTPQTFSDVALTLSRRHGDSLQVIVDPALKAMPVTVIGLENAPSQQIASALAEVYGLHMAPAKPSGMTLGFATATPPQDASSLTKAISDVLPSSIFRALHADRGPLLDAALSKVYMTPRDLGIGMPQRPNVEETPDELRKSMENRRDYNAAHIDIFSTFQQEDALQAIPMQLRITAIRQFRSLVEPQLGAAPSGQVALKSLGNTEHGLFSLILLMDTMPLMEPLVCHSPPPYITNFDQVLLSGGLDSSIPSRPRFSVYLSTLSPDGKQIINQVGMGAGDYIPK